MEKTAENALVGKIQPMLICPRFAPAAAASEGRLKGKHIIRWKTLNQSGTMRPF
ncbi:hypothetical protein NEIELOOT_01635 [Neisseria elongata subsp. glycolytica ATCC 29315]|uniref:Uncharacterized protein n=1 Tax=Neisseria elongata subsp. glycolytica ATCC 29315 TaxID=546263 RepID=D4DRE2_NEIEG|nr:hypothetical protein NEIELOOT_01635 [Neisseria elongata subsp. glycolytica ATCC 29315]